MDILNKRIATQSNRPQHFFTIHWNVGKRCNYDCVYCPDNLHDYTSPHRSLESFQQIFKKIESQIPPKLYIKIWFTGGEPTINPNFLPFVQWLKKEYPERVKNLGLNTNGSRLPKYYKELSQWVEKIQFSSHFGFLKLDKFKDVLSVLPLKKFSVNLMAEPEYWDTVQNIVEFCEKGQINHHIKRIRAKPQWKWMKHNRSYDPFYTPEQIEWLEKREHAQSFDETGERFDQPDMLSYYSEVDEPKEEWANDMITRLEDDFNGWLCGIGLEGCQIDQYGNIQRGVCKIGGSYANIDDEKITLPTEFITCTKKRCSCVADNKCTRYKDESTREMMRPHIQFYIQKNLAESLGKNGKQLTIDDKINY